MTSLTSVTTNRITTRRSIIAVLFPVLLWSDLANAADTAVTPMTEGSKIGACKVRTAPTLVYKIRMPNTFNRPPLLYSCLKPANGDYFR